MRWKNSVVACVVLLFFTTTANASFLSDLIRSIMVGVGEQQDVEKAPECTLSASDALARVVDLLGDGRQAEAEKFIKSAVKSHRDDVRILFAKAVLERSHWDKDAAQVWFAMARKAKGSKALSRAAWLSMKLDMQDSVEEKMDELISISDENPDNIFLLWLGAIQCREQSRSSSPLARSKKNRMAELGAERYEMLLEHFELGPVMMHHTYANILTEDLNRSNEALEHRFIAVSMAAKSWTLEGLADTLTHLKKYRWACVTWRQAAKMNGGKARYYNRWGDALFGLKCYVEAEEKYNEAIRRDSGNGYYWRDLGNTLARLGKEREDETVEAYQQAIELGNEGATEGMAWCYRTGHGVEKDEGKAFEYLQRYLGVNPSHAPSLRTMGFYYNEGAATEKNPRKAIEFYERAVVLEPGNWYGINGLAYALTCIEDSALQDHPRALGLAKRAVEMDENDSTLGTLAAAYFKNGKYEEAVQAMNQSIECWKSLNPEKPVPEKKLRQTEEYKDALAESMETP